jgi:hypothetical protein
MQPVTAISGSTAPGGRAPGRAATPDVPPRTATALVAAGPARPAEAGPALARRPLSAFVAQLIATRRGEPQTRTRRRAEPADAIAVYAAGSAAPSARPPVVLRSL